MPVAEQPLPNQPPPESPDSSLAETPAPAPYPPYRPSPVLLLFLLMPIMASIIALFISGAFTTTDTPQSAPPVVIYTPPSVLGKAAPDFTLLNPRGESVNLSDFQGSWLVLNFWATWCPPCKEEMPLLEQLHRGEITLAQSVPQGVRVLAISYDEKPETVAEFIETYGLSLPTAIDTDAKISNRYIVGQLPVTFFIRPDGVVWQRQMGKVTPELLDRYLTEMAKQPQ
jgi:peroxiredoxin